MDENQGALSDSSGPLPPTPSRYSFASRVLDIFIEPKKVFDYLRNRGDFWCPYIFHTVVLVIVTCLALPAVKQVSSEYAGLMGRSTPPEVGLTDYLMTPVQVAAGLAISFAVLGFVIWLAVLISSGKARYGQALSLAAYTFFPVLLAKVINGITLMITRPSLGDPSVMMVTQAPVINYTSLAQLFAGRPILQTSLLPVGIFTLWALYLLVIGLRRSANVSMVAAWVTALSLLVVQVGLYALMAFGMAMSLKAVGAG